MLNSQQNTNKELQSTFDPTAGIIAPLAEKPKVSATYYRYSSDNQREESIEAQAYASENYARENGFVIKDSYIDRALSGTTDNRPAFQRMINDAKEGKFQYIIIHKYDRFSRSVEDSAKYIRELQRYGVTVVSVLEQFGDDPEGELMRNITVAFNQFYVKNLAREVKKGLLVNARKAKHNGGKPPLGYRVNSQNEYEIEPSDAEIVKFIYTNFLEGMSYTKIISELKKKGMCKSNGLYIASNSIYDILKNEKYTGTYVYNRSISRDPITKKRTNRKNKNEENIVKIPDALPKIISKEDFTRVQDIMVKRKNLGGTNKASELYLSTGLVWCKKCNTKMYGNTRQNGVKSDGTRNSVRTYRCKCKDCYNEIMSEKLDQYIYSLILNLFKAKSASYLEEAMASLQSEQITSEKDIVKNLTNECSILKRDIESIINKTVLTNDDRILLRYYDMIKEKEDRLLDLTTQIKVIETKINTITSDRAAIKEVIERAPTMLKSLDGKIIQSVFKTFIDRIEIDEHTKTAEIILNLGSFLYKGGEVVAKTKTIPISAITAQFKKRKIKIDYSRKDAIV